MNKNKNNIIPSQQSPSAGSLSVQPALNRLGIAMFAVASGLLMALLGWQSYLDFQLLKRQHQALVEEAVWRTADQMELNLATTSQALTALLDSLDTKPAAEAAMAAQVLLPGVYQLHRVDPGQVPASSHEPWAQSVRRLQLSGEPFALASDAERNLLFWTLGSQLTDRYWVLRLDERALSAVVSARSGRGYQWLLEDTGQGQVLARQQQDRLAFLGGSAMTGEERERVVVSAPVSGTLWQVRGLVDPHYYASQLAPLLVRKAGLFGGCLLVLVAALWFMGRQARVHRMMQVDQDRSARSLLDTERRYRDIFQGVDIALFLVDLVDIKQLLMREGIFNAEQLDRWLLEHPERQEELLQALRILEANQVALDLFGVSDASALVNIFQGERHLRPGGGRYRLLLALMNGDERFELETPLRRADGSTIYVWVVMRLPDSTDALHAVTVSVTDLSQRRAAELTLRQSREFWAEVVRSVPDLIYIRDTKWMGAGDFLFSNRTLAELLGYSAEEESSMGADYRTRLLHPDDLEYMQTNRRLQLTLGDDQVLDWRVRWRHRADGWRWFSVRSKVFKRAADGRVVQVIGFVRDIHEQTLANEQIQRSEARYRQLTESISDIVWSTDSDFRTDYISPSVQRLLGYSPEFMLSKAYVESLADERFVEFMGRIREELRELVHVPERAAVLREQGYQRQITFDGIKADGRKCPLEVRITLMWSAQGRFLGLLGLARDVSEQRRTENRLRMAATVFENTTGGILVTDPAGYIVQVNENFSRITGYSTEQVVDQTPSMLVSQSGDRQFYADILAALQDQGHWEGEVWQRRASGEVFPSWAGITAVHDNDGDLVSYVCFFVDISERKASEERIQSLAYYDVLTGLANRTLFQDRLQAALQLAARKDEWVAVLFLDLDRFKPINDSLGHAAGDQVLKEVAQRLRSCVRESDTVARMGGDEFTMLLSGLVNREVALSTAMHVAEKVLNALAEAFVLQGRDFFVTASIGVALYPQDGAESSILMKNADTAMYHAKEAGKATFQFYQADMNAKALERLALENDLRRALQEQAFELAYQPQFSCLDGQLTGAEALLRWRDPERGSVSPAEFIPIAEELGLIRGLGEWVMEEACRQVSCWRGAGLNMPRLAVNLSAMQFDDGALVGQIVSALERHQLTPDVLELELTESTLLRNIDATMRTLEELKERGMQIAIDDFGTGYSALNYLRDLPIDTLKIDRGFIQSMRPGSRDALLAQAIVAMGRSLQLRVIAEGIETQEQYQLVSSFGCDEVQGYHLGRPVTAEEFEQRWLRSAE
ncbi:EAL domain-containing protein [Halopseudomonas sp.]|uniref:bifunctional diguanylate cyclase/phosphodiesterase n=1 Tax=Halopseudomonas sp. TaxID=2901191 RepID=UPI00311D38A8